MRDKALSGDRPCAIYIYDITSLYIKGVHNFM